MAQWIDEWNSEQWRESAANWIDEACSAYGIERVAGPDFWPASLDQVSALVGTDAAELVFKANAPGLAAEAAVTITAGGLQPERVVMPLAIDRMAGYMLSPDFGHTLADLGDSAENWQLALASLGSFQVALMGNEEAFFDVGMPVVDPQFLPEQFEQALTMHVSLEANHPLHLDPQQADALHGQLKTLSDACEALHRGPIPLSLEHGAFDLAQTVVPSEKGQHARITNFATAHWAHPFSSLAAPLAAMTQSWKCRTDDERVMRALGAYLGEFAAYGSPDELYGLVAPACLVAPLSQHETWLRLLLDADDEHLQENAASVLDTLFIN